MRSILLAAILAFPLAGCGRFLATYDLSIETRVPAGISTNAYFGQYEFMCGALSGGRCVNVGASAWITDTARLEWGSGVDRIQRVKKFRVQTPWHWPNQKYHFLFTIYPGDSATLETQVLKKNDCSHLKYGAKIAYAGSSPCSW